MTQNVLDFVEEAFKIRCKAAFESGSDMTNLVEEFVQLSGEHRVMIWCSLAQKCRSPEFAKFLHKNFAGLVLKGVASMTPEALMRCQEACTLAANELL